MAPLSPVVLQWSRSTCDTQQSRRCFDPRRVSGCPFVEPVTKVARMSVASSERSSGKAGDGCRTESTKAPQCGSDATTARTCLGRGDAGRAIAALLLVSSRHRGGVAQCSCLRIQLAQPSERRPWQSRHVCVTLMNRRRSRDESMHQHKFIAASLVFGPVWPG